jgi:hypothetical protein
MTATVDTGPSLRWRRRSSPTLEQPRVKDMEGQRQLLPALTRRLPWPHVRGRGLAAWPVQQRGQHGFEATLEVVDDPRAA